MIKAPTIFAETNRTILREITLDDVEGFFEMDSDPEVHRYLGTKPVTGHDQIIEMVHYIRKQYADNGIGRWAVIDRRTLRFIGWSGLKLVKDEINHQTHYYDLGYRLVRKYWGQGIASETVPPALAYGFEKLQVKKIIATVHVDNTASNQVAMKAGFSFCETFFLHGLEHNWYELTYSEWLRKKEVL